MNKKYPNRPESLTLEELSRRYFQSQLPEDWLPEKPSSDYGIDVRVDIFKNHSTTGLELLVQLKSSQKSSQKEYENVSLKVSTYNYLHDKLQVSILVKFIQVENEAYWLLIKDIPSPNQDNESFTVNIPKTNKLSEIKWEEIYSYIQSVTSKKLASIRIDALNKRKKYLEIAENIKSANQYNKTKERYFSSSEGVEKAENEVEKLFNKITDLISEINKPSSGLFIKISREDDNLRKILEIINKNLILSFVWHNDYRNSLKSSSLNVWITRNFRAYDDYGEQGDVILHEIYYSNISLNENIGWSESTDNKEIITSDDLADNCLSRFLESFV